MLGNMLRGIVFRLFLLSGIIYISLAAKLIQKSTDIKADQDESKRYNCNYNNNNNGQWINEATGHFIYECTGRNSITLMASKFDQEHRDRRWRMACGYNKAVKNCFWTPYINNFDKPLSFRCPHDGFIAGFESDYKKKNYDRRYKIKCCNDYKRYATRNCIQSHVVNDWKKPFNYGIERGKGYYLVGVYSEHANKFQ
ncbi:hypothetical protein OS493_030457 [Desmophyllum pertusum]|uniref:Dermatopontin n=1 Tax=Desmophyllum pertusum TaxID=174260 RepID=A0A9W9YWK3_9CNID|nr:hypothetical protein OS493_030457 [Desmophyllum pertusum]